MNDTLNLLDKNPNERNNHFIELDKYGKFPFEALAAELSGGRREIQEIEDYSTGLLPWQIGVYNAKLTEDLKMARWEDAKLDAAFLADYVAEAH